MGENKKCSKHGYYWVDRCCDGQVTDDICPKCLSEAAPALLAACEKVVKDYNDFAETDDGDTWDEQMGVNVERARRAIADAKPI